MLHKMPGEAILLQGGLLRPVRELRPAKQEAAFRLEDIGIALLNPGSGSRACRLEVGYQACPTCPGEER